MIWHSIRFDAWNGRPNGSDLPLTTILRSRTMILVTKRAQIERERDRERQRVKRERKKAKWTLEIDLTVWEWANVVSNQKTVQNLENHLFAFSPFCSHFLSLFLSHSGCFFHSSSLCVRLYFDRSNSSGRQSRIRNKSKSLASKIFRRPLRSFKIFYFLSFFLSLFLIDLVCSLFLSYQTSLYFMFLWIKLIISEEKNFIFFLFFFCFFLPLFIFILNPLFSVVLEILHPLSFLSLSLPLPLSFS